MLSPTFTSNKTKTMSKLMSECSSRFVEHLSNQLEKQRETEMKDLLMKYTNDVIASCNVSIDSVKEPNFYEYDKLSTSTMSFKWSLKLLVHRNDPQLAELLQLNFVDNHIVKFFYDQMAETVEMRQQTGDRRYDILQFFTDNNKKRAVETDDRVRYGEPVISAFSFFFGGSTASRRKPVGRESGRSRKNAAGDGRDIRN